MSDHILKRYDKELNKLKFRLVKMCGIVQEQVHNSVKSMLELDMELAKSVIVRDDKVDKIDIKIEKQCLRIFALHQPVAMDLRLVISAVSINDKLELIGDIAENIAKCVLYLEGSGTFIRATKFRILVDYVFDVLEKSFDSLTFGDAELAREVILLYKKDKGLINENLQSIIDTIHAQPNNGDKGARLVVVNRNLKIISSMCVSIAEEVLFLEEGKFAHHADLDNSHAENEDENPEAQEMI